MARKKKKPQSKQVLCYSIYQQRRREKVKYGRAITPLPPAEARAKAIMMNDEEAVLIDAKNDDVDETTSISGLVKMKRYNKRKATSSSVASSQKVNQTESDGAGQDESKDTKLPPRDEKNVKRKRGRPSKKASLKGKNDTQQEHDRRSKKAKVSSQPDIEVKKNVSRVCRKDERKQYHDIGDIVNANWEQLKGPYWMRGVVTSYRIHADDDDDDDNKSLIECRSYSVSFDDEEVVHNIHEIFLEPYEDYQWLQDKSLASLGTVVKHSFSSTECDQYLEERGWFDVTLSSGTIKRCHSVCQVLRVLDDDLVEKAGLSALESLHLPQEWSSTGNQGDLRRKETTKNALTKGQDVLPVVLRELAKLSSMYVGHHDCYDSVYNGASQQLKEYIDQYKDWRNRKKSLFVPQYMSKVFKVYKRALQAKQSTLIPVVSKNERASSLEKRDVAVRPKDPAEVNQITKFDAEEDEIDEEEYEDEDGDHNGIHDEFEMEEDDNDMDETAIATAISHFPPLIQELVKLASLQSNKCKQQWIAVYEMASPTLKKFMDSRRDPKSGRLIQEVLVPRHLQDDFALYRRILRSKKDKRKQSPWFKVNDSNKAKRVKARRTAADSAASPTSELEVLRWETTDRSELVNFSKSDVKSFAKYIQEKYNQMVYLMDFEPEIVIMAYLLSKWSTTLSAVAIRQFTKTGSYWLDMYEEAPKCVREFMDTKLPKWKLQGAKGKRLVGNKRIKRFQKLRTVIDEANQIKGKETKKIKGEKEPASSIQRERRQQPERNQQSSSLPLQRTIESRRASTSERSELMPNLPRDYAPLEAVENAAGDVQSEREEGMNELIEALCHPTVEGGESRGHAREITEALARWHDKFVRRSMRFEDCVARDWSTFREELMRGWLEFTDNHNEQLWDRFYQKQESLWQSWLYDEEAKVCSNCCRISQSLSHELPTSVIRCDNRHRALDEESSTLDHTPCAMYAERLRRFLSRREDRIRMFLNRCKILAFDFYSKEKAIQVAEWRSFCEEFEDACDEFRSCESRMLSIHMN